MPSRPYAAGAGRRPGGRSGGPYRAISTVLPCWLPGVGPAKPPSQRLASAHPMRDGHTSTDNPDSVPARRPGVLPLKNGGAQPACRPRRPRAEPGDRPDRHIEHRLIAALLKPRPTTAAQGARWYGLPRSCSAERRRRCSIRGGPLAARRLGPVGESGPLLGR